MKKPVRRNPPNPAPHRWTNKRADGSKVVRGKSWTYWTNQRCPNCGRKYGLFRMPVDRETVYAELRQQHDAGEIRALTLRTLLGRLHELKQKVWEAHIAACEVEQAHRRGELGDREMEERMHDIFRTTAPGRFITWKERNRR